MLPLVQAHRMVPVPPAFESLPPFRQQPDYALHHHLSRLSKDSTSSLLHHAQNERGFPIRTSLPAQPAQPFHRRVLSNGGSSQLADHPDHQLRRKTPNGTIDDGYDGSLAQLVGGPPPLKQMIIPASSNNFLRNTIGPVDSPLSVKISRGSQTTSPPSLSEHPQRIFDSASSSASMPYKQPRGRVSSNSAQFSRQQIDFTSLSSVYRSGNLDETAASNLTAYQHYASSTTPGPRSYHSSPLADDGAPSSDIASAPQSGRQHLSSTPGGVWRVKYEQSSSVSHSQFIAGLPYVQPHGHFPNISSSADSRHNNTHASHLNLETLSLETSQASPSQNINVASVSPLRFREKALDQAHRTYVDLLAYLHQSRKAQHTRIGTNTNSRMIVYPKPPKRAATGLRSLVPDIPQRVSHVSYDGKMAFGYPVIGELKPLPPTPLPSLDFQTSHAEDYGTHNPVTNFSGCYIPSKRSSDAVKGSPLFHARTSLEMLSHLCGQSGWKWIDGMLLGGCLHYGLEHYEEALEWFSRIMILDSSHVEALSNMAATLYCLNRQEEAEKCWLQAIHIRPHYLEAVEHLVGLLYKKRSREAVEIISFVQRALKLPTTATASINDTTVNSSNRSGHKSPKDTHIYRERAPDCMGELSLPRAARNWGFGSSGYAISGTENGRILALIHAKGTMLYSLKEISQASEAFEEAVLISTGRRMRCIEALVERIQTVLSPGTGTTGGQGLSSIAQPLLLPPEKARHTARLVFSGNGDLPGLCLVPEGSPRKAAVQTTSNSLLSLAKIFQDAMSSGTSYPSMLRQHPGVGDILALYYLSLSLQESPSTANNVGILLASVQASSPMGYRASSADLLTHPKIPGIQPGSGLALALAYYSYGLTLDPKHVHLHTNLGSLLKDIGQLDHAIKMYEEAVSCDGTFDIALTNLANAVKDRGRINDAIMYYERAVKANPDFAEAVCGLSTALSSVCDWRGRGGALLGGGRYDRWHVDKDGMLFDAKTREREVGLMRRVVDIVQRQLIDAASWGVGVLREDTLSSLALHLQHIQAGETDGDFDVSSSLQRLAGAPWEGSVVLRLVERATKASMRRWFRDRYINRKEAASGYLRARLPSTLTVPSAPTVLPFHTFTCPLSAKDVRQISQRNALRISCSTLRSPWLPTSVYPPPCPPTPHLNVGYVSSDFNNHPLAHLMQSVFGLHNRSRVRAYCYATTASDRSVHRLQIEREAPVFRDVSNWTSDKLVEQIVQDGIHILVNLNGYTRGARNEIFAARPAPIQMSFMGFAGTLGAEWCDYILADTVAIPPETLRPWRRNLDIADIFSDETEQSGGEWVYSENVIFCRETFFCCDHAQSSDADEPPLSWEDEQRRRWKMRKELFPNITDDTIILGNFNQLYKIDPTTFRAWLRILSSVPRAILWLLRFPELGETNLRRTARMWAGGEVASRLYFTDVAPKHQHISRARVCDLFLDTPECNAHTTAADVLWSSTPLLTLTRYPYKMCSRMAASILKGALPKSSEGLQAMQQLVASSDDEYEDFAIKLASGLHYRIGEGGYGEGNGRLADLRRLLYSNKRTCALFDTRRWVSDLERAYEEAWRRWVAGDGGDIYL